MPEHGFRHRDIAETAYYIWQDEGRVHGHDEEHWSSAIDCRTNDFKRDFPKLSQLYYEMPNRTGYGDWFHNLPLHVYSSELSYEVFRYWLERMLAELKPSQWNLYKDKLVKGCNQKRNQLFPLINEVWGYKYLAKALDSRSIQIDTIDDPKAVQIPTQTGMYPEWVAMHQGTAVAAIEVKTVSSISSVTEQSLHHALMTPPRPNSTPPYQKAEQQLHSIGASNLLRFAYIILDLNAHPEPSVRERDTLTTIRSFFSNLRRCVDVIVEIRLWPNRPALYEEFPPT